MIQVIPGAFAETQLMYEAVIIFQETRKNIEFKVLKDRDKK
jgi:hypothetical protein